MKISILGYGTFGSAIASRLILNGHEILEDEVVGSDIIIVSTPSYRVKVALLSHKKSITNQQIIICSKGFDEGGELISNVLKREFPTSSIYFLYGPTLAGEIRNGNISAMVLAGGEGKEELKKVLESPSLFIELSDDVIGVQVGATLKNAAAIFIGLVEGAGLGLNTEAFVYTKGLYEIQKLGVSLGARPETFAGLSCAGDLYLRSRSRMLGIEIGKGKSFEEVSKKVVYPKEGIVTLKNLSKIEEQLKIDLTFFKLINSVVFEGMSVKEAVERLAKMI